MKTHGTCAWLRWFGISVFALAVSLAATEQKAVTGERLLVRPDLKIASVQAERVGFTVAGEHRVRVRVTVVNSAFAAVCAGPFTVRLESRALPGGVYAYYGQESVARLCADPTRAKSAISSLDFEETIPSGGQRSWRATVDPENLVPEAAENNNSAESAIYVAKTFCPGVDLVLRSVEIKREADGQVYIRGQGLNRCIGSCSSNVKFTFAVADPDLPEETITQPLTVAIGSLSEFACMYVGVYSRSDRSVTYRVRIDPESGACVDANPANNECLVTFAAGETGKTQGCH